MSEEKRCWWCGDDPLYQRYHDEEWGRPSADDNALFEKLCLEGFQAGLSWITILRKREHFRAAFDNFAIDAVRHYTDKDVTRLLGDDRIVRHRGKIEATINNAQCAHSLVAEFGALHGYFWQFVPDSRTRPRRITREVIGDLATTDESKRMSKDLKRRGFKFVGPTTCYSFMQSMGMVNDHVDDCFVRDEVTSAQRAFSGEKVRPA